MNTSVAYLIGEADEIVSDKTDIAPNDGTVIVQTNDPSRKIYTELGTLNFNNGEISISMPDTPRNKKLFDELLAKVMLFSNKRMLVPTLHMEGSKA